MIANIDTVTERLLEDILAKLPSGATRAVIAHRLNTIKNADQIFFVNTCTITSVDSMEGALDMLLHGKGWGGVEFPFSHPHVLLQEIPYSPPDEIRHGFVIRLIALVRETMSGVR